ncbi:MAG: hypothetical protein AB1560_11100 [Pseudomonadota bacterium]
MFLLVAGCAGVERAPPASSAPAPETAATEPSKPAPADAAAARTEPPAAGLPAKPAAEPSGKKPGATPAPAKKATPPPLDLTALETRLKETKAIGVFTKITLKNQVDDLLEQFRAYYQGRAKTTLAELRRPYDGLVLKVLSLLQDGDPELARAIVASREAIWGILADPNKFATL